jgi:hypothetical protein
VYLLLPVVRRPNAPGIGTHHNRAVMGPRPATVVLVQQMLLPLLTQLHNEFLSSSIFPLNLTGAIVIVLNVIGIHLPSIETLLVLSISVRKSSFQF